MISEAFRLSVQERYVTMIPEHKIAAHKNDADRITYEKKE